ncbi:MAG: ThiF family adenylyltransferase [Erysipelotrichaceae bacterium]
MLDLIRLEIIMGAEKLKILQNKKVMILGLGGVGGFVSEALVRSGIRKFTLVDFDKVSTSNFNRQIIATSENLGKFKTSVIAERILSINADAEVEEVKLFIKKEDIDGLNFDEIDYIIDCIDTSTTKIALIEKAKALEIPIISAMGFGNKVNPELIKITDISKTSVCPLARVIRVQLRKSNIKKLKVAYSLEQPIEKKQTLYNDNGKITVGSYVVVIGIAGFKIANEVIFDLLKEGVNLDE